MISNITIVVANTIAHVLSSSMLASLTSQCRDKCQNTVSRFLGAVPRYPLNWIVLRYSMVATGGLLGQLLVVASGGHHPILAAPPLAPCIDQNSHRHSVPTICLWPEWRPPVSDQAASTHSSSSRFVVSAKIPLQDFLVSANIPTGLSCAGL